MTNLFGKSELEKLRDLDYKTESHTFSKAVIAAYYNGMEYPMEVREDYIWIKRRKGKVHFILEPITPNNYVKDKYVVDSDKDTIYSQWPTHFAKVKTKEVIYNLDEIFTNPSKQVRRGMKLLERKEITLKDQHDVHDVTELYEEWAQHKMDDPKTFRIAFTPKRYLRSFRLRDKGFCIAEQYYYVNKQLYGALSYEVCQNGMERTAFELAFISRFWDKNLKLTNDLNELILINSFYQLWKKAVSKINVGPTAGIKGLKIFKAKLPFTEHYVYSN